MRENEKKPLQNMQFHDFAVRFRQNTCSQLRFRFPPRFIPGTLPMVRTFWSALAPDRPRGPFHPLCSLRPPFPSFHPLFLSSFLFRVGCTGTSCYSTTRVGARARTSPPRRDGPAGPRGLTGASRGPPEGRRFPGGGGRGRKWKNDGRRRRAGMSVFAIVLVVRVKGVQEGRVVAGRVQVLAGRRGQVPVDQVVALLVLQDHQLRRKTRTGRKEER